VLWESARQRDQVSRAVGVAIGGPDPHLTLTNQREPVAPCQSVSRHRGPVEELDRVEIQIAQPTAPVALDQRSVLRVIEWPDRIVGAPADRQVRKVAAVVCIEAGLARVIELQDGRQGARMQIGQQRAQTHVLAARRAAPIGERITPQRERIRVAAGGGRVGALRGAGDLDAHQARDAVVEAELPDQRAVVEDVVVLGGDDHVGSLRGESGDAPAQREGGVVARRRVHVQVRRQPAGCVEYADRGLDVEPRPLAGDELDLGRADAPLGPTSGQHSIMTGGQPDVVRIAGGAGERDVIGFGGGGDALLADPEADAVAADQRVRGRRHTQEDQAQGLALRQHQRGGLRRRQRTEVDARAVHPQWMRLELIAGPGDQQLVTNVLAGRQAEAHAPLRIGSHECDRRVVVTHDVDCGVGLAHRGDDLGPVRPELIRH